MLTVALMISIVAWVYCVILTHSGMIFYNLKIFIEANVPEWLYKPLIGCEYCFGGQVAFWSYFFLFDYNLFKHIFFICLTIFIIKIINTLIYGRH